MKGAHLYDDGRVRRVESYAEGLRHGRWQMFRADGRLWRESFYVRGIREGMWRTFYPDGAPESSVEYRGGGCDGESLFWYRDRRLKIRSIFAAGSYADGRSQEHWDETGALTFWAEYAGGKVVAHWRA